jgi:hypothetical protein
MSADFAIVSEMAIIRWLPTYPPIFPGKNLKTKGLNGRKSNIRLYLIRLYFQDSKLEGVFPHFGENSIVFGIK